MPQRAPRSSSRRPGIGSISPLQALLASVRQPIVLILLLIAFFTTISGKPLDGFLMLTVAILLIWGATRSRLGGQVNSAGASASPSVAAATTATDRAARALAAAWWPGSPCTSSPSRSRTTSEVTQLLFYPQLGYL
jgi:hypothetical protein